VSLVNTFCWKPNINPFTGAPDTKRIDSTTVRVMWDDVFPKGRDCDDVEFLIKSHPLDAPSNYKLSDLTLKGKRSATMAVPQGEDFIFQVIARENKGTGIGIEYAYSRPATSVFNPSPNQISSLKQSIWIAGDTRSGNVRPQGNFRAPGLQARTTRRTVPPTTTTRPPPPPTTPRTYLRPSVRSLESRYSYVPDYYTDEEEEAGSVGNPWYVYECIPLLKNLAGFDEGSKRNSILTQFIKHMNTNAVSTVQNFIGGKKSCKSGYTGQEAGHLVEGDGTAKCCSTPWGDNSPQTVCYEQFARCDGHCIPHDWVSDGWPDCMDGADEATLTVDGKVMPYQLGCVHCAGVVLSAAFLCLESSSHSGGLTRNCVENILGPGQCNVCIQEFMDLP